jgi:hypothetical protein
MVESELENKTDLILLFRSAGFPGNPVRYPTSPPDGESSEILPI